MSTGAGKGDTPRKVNGDKLRANYERIFNKDEYFLPIWNGIGQIGTTEKIPSDSPILNWIKPKGFSEMLDEHKAQD